MAKYLLLWQLDPARIPADPKERGAGWSALIAMVKEDLEKGILKDWGSFVAESKGFGIMEGDETEIAINMQRYAPYVGFESHSFMSAGEVEKMIKALAG
ncbi:MAG: hypothetical protein P8175_11930 [Deltaproteobacteria bacterium]|jgi:hypothetical protein